MDDPGRPFAGFVDAAANADAAGNDDCAAWVSRVRERDIFPIRPAQQGVW